MHKYISSYIYIIPILLLLCFSGCSTTPVVIGPGLEHNLQDIEGSVGSAKEEYDSTSNQLSNLIGEVGSSTEIYQGITGQIQQSNQELAELQVQSGNELQNILHIISEIENFGR